MTANVQLSAYIDKILRGSEQNISKNIIDFANIFTNNYRNNHNYEQNNIIQGLLQLNEKIRHYENSIAEILIAYQPAQKLGKVMKIIINSFTEILEFANMESKRKKSQLEQKIQSLEKELTRQGVCVRCQKFLQMINVSDSKIQLGVGQFYDPFNLFDKGECEFTTRRKVQEEEYLHRKRLAEVWENKKNIQQKMYKLTRDFQRRIYNYEFNLSETESFQQIIKNQMYEIQNELKYEKYTTQSNFLEHLEVLVKKIFDQLKIYAKNSQTSHHVSTQAYQDYFFRYTKDLESNNEKLQGKIKQYKQQQHNWKEKMEDLRKIIRGKDKQIENLNHEKIQIKKKIEEQDNHIKILVKKIKESETEKNNLQIKFHELKAIHKESLNKIEYSKGLMRAKDSKIAEFQKSMKALSTLKNLQVEQNNYKNEDDHILSCRSNESKSKSLISHTNSHLAIQEQIDTSIRKKPNKRSRTNMQINFRLSNEEKDHKSGDNNNESAIDKQNERTDSLSIKINNKITQLSIDCNQKESRKENQMMDEYYKTKSTSKKTVKGIPSIKIIKSIRNVSKLKDSGAEKEKQTKEVNDDEQQQNDEEVEEASVLEEQREDSQNEEAIKKKRTASKKSSIKMRGTAKQKYNEKKLINDNFKKSATNLKKSLLKKKEFSKLNQITFTQGLNDQVPGEGIKKPEHSNINRVVFALPTHKYSSSEKKNSQTYQHRQKSFLNSGVDYESAIRVIFNHLDAQVEYKDFCKTFNEFLESFGKESFQNSQIILNESKLLMNKPLKQNNSPSEKTCKYSKSVYPRKYQQSQPYALKNVLDSLKTKNNTFYVSSANQSNSFETKSKTQYLTPNISPTKRKLPSLHSQHNSYIFNNTEKLESKENADMFSVKDILNIFHSVESAYIAEFIQTMRKVKESPEQIFSQKQNAMMRRMVIYLAQIHADRPNIYQKIKYQLQYPFSYGFTESGLTLNINPNLCLSSQKAKTKSKPFQGIQLDNILKTIIIIHRNCSKNVVYEPINQGPICKHLKQLQERIKSVVSG